MHRESTEDVLDRPAVAPRAQEPSAEDLMAAIDDTADALQELEIRVRDALGINAMDNAVLRWVDRERRRGGPTRVGDITAHFGVSSGSATEIVHRLTRADLLRREVHPTDARVRRLVPTETARARLDALVGGVQADLAGLLEGLGAEDRRRFVELLVAVAVLLRADRTAAVQADPAG